MPENFETIPTVHSVGDIGPVEVYFDPQADRVEVRYPKAVVSMTGASADQDYDGSGVLSIFMTRAQWQELVSRIMVAMAELP